MADVKGIDRASVKLKENISKKLKETSNIKSSVFSLKDLCRASFVCENA